MTSFDISSEQPPTTTDPETPATKKTKQGVRKIDTVKEYGQNTELPSVQSNIHCIPIIGQIEGHIVLPPNNKTTKYEHVIPQLVAVEQNPEIEGLLVILNTVGGDVEAGLAIAMIVSMSKPTVSLVLGGGHSIGVPVAVAPHILLYRRDGHHDYSPDQAFGPDHRCTSNVGVPR